MLNIYVVLGEFAVFDAFPAWGSATWAQPYFINGFLLTATIVLILFIFMITIIFLMRHFIKKYDENLVLGFAEVTNIVVILTIVSSEA